MSGCGGGSSSSKDYYKNAVSNATVYVAPRPSAINRVAVLPFKAPTELIGSAVSDIFTMELLRTERYTLVERSQISGVLGETELSLSGLSEEAAITAGRMLGADAVILGTVDEYATVASGGNTYPVVGASIRMIDCTSGEVMWSVGHSIRSEERLATLSSHARAVILEMMVALVQNWELQPKDPSARNQPIAIAPQAPPHPQTAPVVQPAAAPQPPAIQEQQSLQPPQDLSVSDMGLREVRLSWPKPATDLKYRVERSLTAEGPFQEIRTVPSSQGSFDDRGSGSAALEDGKVYYYRVVAIDSQGQESQPSPVRESMTSPAPDPPKDLKAEMSGGETVTLRWSPANAEGVVKYLIERKGPQDNSFIQVGETDTTEFREEATGSSSPVDAGRCSYRVRAMNRVGAKGEPSAEVQVVGSGAGTAPVTATVTVPAEAPPAAIDGTLRIEPAENAKPMAETTAMTPAAGQEPEGTSSKVEEIEQPDGTKVKKVTTTTKAEDAQGGTSTVTTTEITTSDKTGFLKKENQVVTTTITPEKGGGETTVSTTEVTITNKDGSSRNETQTYKTQKK